MKIWFNLVYSPDGAGVSRVKRNWYLDFTEKRDISYWFGISWNYNNSALNSRDMSISIWVLDAVIFCCHSNYRCYLTRHITAWNYLEINVRCSQTGERLVKIQRFYCLKVHNLIVFYCKIMLYSINYTGYIS